MITAFHNHRTLQKKLGWHLVKIQDFFKMLSDDILQAV